MFTIINELPPETVGQLYLASDPENRKYALKSLNFVKKIDKEDIALEREVSKLLRTRLISILL